MAHAVEDGNEDKGAWTALSQAPVGHSAGFDESGAVDVTGGDKGRLAAKDDGQRAFSSLSCSIHRCASIATLSSHEGGGNEGKDQFLKGNRAPTNANYSK